MTSSEASHVLRRNSRTLREVRMQLKLTSDREANRGILDQLRDLEANEEGLNESLRELSRSLSRIRSAERSDKNSQ